MRTPHSWPAPLGPPRYEPASSCFFLLFRDPVSLAFASCFWSLDLDAGYSRLVVPDLRLQEAVSEDLFPRFQRSKFSRRGCSSAVLGATLSMETAILINARPNPARRLTSTAQRRSRNQWRLVGRVQERRN
jgi:hypothetical protein